MKIIELVGKVKAANPDLFKNKQQEKLAADVLRSALGVIRQELEDTETGAVGVAGLGRFQVRNVERKNEEGKAVTRRLITFAMQKRKVQAD